MFTVEGTELKYSEADKVCLDFYLGGHSEDMIEWAQRVWTNCLRSKAGHTTQENGKKLASVYKNDAFELWESKKRRRRAAMMLTFTGFKCPEELVCYEKIAKDLKDNKECEWPVELLDENVLSTKINNASYRTAKERHLSEEENFKNNLALENNKARENTDMLKAKGFDAETIKIIYPESEGLI